MRFNGLFKKFFMAFAAVLLVLSCMEGSSSAAAIEFSTGFPKVSGKNVLLQWNPVSGASEYKVYRGDGGKAGLVATVKTNKYIDKNVPAGKTFRYSVAAVAGGKETRSAEVSVSVAAEKVFVPLKAPKLLAARLKDMPGNKVSVGLLWEGASGTDLVGINVYRSKARGKDYVMVGSSQSDTYTDNDVKPGETYYYVVTAVDSKFDETKYSNEISALVPAPAQKAPEKAAAPAAPEKAPPTIMRSAKLLFRLPGENMRRGEPAPENPTSVIADEAVGHIYVSSLGYGGILVYDMDGRFQFGIRKDGVGGDQKFIPGSAAIGEGGNIYVADRGSSEVLVFDFGGRVLDPVRSDNSKIPDYSGVRPVNFGVAIGPGNTLYVCDPTSDSVHVFDSRRKQRLDIVGAISVDKKKMFPERVLFNGPSFMTVTKEGDLVFVDSGYSKLHVFDEQGRYKRSIGKPGVNAGELNYPTGLAIGSKGEVISASGTTPNVQAFGLDGTFLYALCNEKCDGPIEVGGMRGIYLDSQNRLYVAEGANHRVSVFQLSEKTVEVVPKQ